jgi:hypothetical protein
MMNSSRAFSRRNSFTRFACVRHILGDGAFEMLLANAAHVKNLPSRKTDVNDAT